MPLIAHHLRTLFAHVRWSPGRRRATSGIAAFLVVATIGTSQSEMDDVVALTQARTAFTMARLAGATPGPGPGGVAAAAPADTTTATVGPGAGTETAAAEAGGSAVPATVQATPTTAPPPPQPSVLPAVRGAVPVGKGMWLYLEERTEGGNAQAIVAKAKQFGLSHLYVRTGSSWGGFYAQDFLNRLLPEAHAAGIRVFGWDFPNLRDARGDVDRAVAAIRYTTPDGHRIDGFAPDIETRFEGTNMSADTAVHYGTALRLAVGGSYPLVVVVPNPTPARVADYPYTEVVGPFDAVAPMVYWLNRQPDSDVANALVFFARFGKPVLPIGQAYDGGPEGGRPGVPPRDELLRFFAAADEYGAAGVSFWSWQAADQQAWDAVRDAPQFALAAQAPVELNRGQARGIQVLLSTLGFAAPSTGVVDDATKAAIAAYQHAAGLPPTGVLDEVTYRLLMTPFGPPINPVV